MGCDVDAVGQIDTVDVDRCAWPHSRGVVDIVVGRSRVGVAMGESWLVEVEFSGAGRARVMVWGLCHKGWGRI